MPLPRAVIFDMDGVLIDSHQCAYTILTDSLAKFNISISVAELKTWGSLSLKQFWLKVKHDYPLDEDLDFLINSYDLEKEISFYSAIGLMPNVEDFIDILIKKNIKIALATSAERIRVNKVLSLGRLCNKFSHIVTAEDVLHHKPDPECYITACKLLDVLPEHAMAIEDSQNGARAAFAAGCRVTAFHGSMWDYDNFEAKYSITTFESLFNLEQLWLDEIPNTL